MNVAKCTAISAALLGIIAAGVSRASAAGFGVSPQAISFGTIPVGTASAPKTVTVTNHNSVAIHVTGVTPSGEFTLQSDGCSGINLAAKASCTVSVSFTPAQAGALSGKLAITGTAGRRTRIRPQAVQLSGTAGEFGFGNLIYVTNPYVDPDIVDGNSVTSYPGGFTGDVLPFSEIIGPDTQLSYPFGIALYPPTDELFVANYSYNSITIYHPSTSSGDVIPSAVFSGPNTGITNPEGIAVDFAHSIYLANNDGGAPYFGSITQYRCCTAGNVPPAATINGPDTGLAYPVGIAVDALGTAYVANSEGGPNGDGSVTIYPAPAFTGGGGNITPSQTITGPLTFLSQPIGIALGPFFPPIPTVTPTATPTATATGRASPTFTFISPPARSTPKMTPAGSGSAAGVPIPASPTATLTLTPTATPTATPPGAIYVSNQGSGEHRCGPDPGGCVTIYKLPLKSPTGNPDDVPPDAVIVGPDTQLNEIAGIAVDQEGFIYVVSFTDPGAILIFAPGSHGDTPPIGIIAGPDTGLFAPWGIVLGPGGCGTARGGVTIPCAGIGAGFAAEMALNAGAARAALS